MDQSNNETITKSPGKMKPKKGKGKAKVKMTKEERRAKYTAIARDRRNKRMTRNRDKDLVCYRCRKKGHSAENCTSGADGNSIEGRDNNSGKKKQGGMICYKCGSTEHRIQQCSKIKPYLKPGQTKVDFGKIGELPYAKCYVCNELGHLSAYCPKGSGGVFPDGGTCRECGEPGHFAKDCPSKKKGRDADDDGSVKSSNSVTIEQYLEESDGENEVKETPKKKKVVNF
jgi:zinc finger CCHC domain-containing protein 9